MAFNLRLAQFFLGFAYARALGLKFRLLLLKHFSHLLGLGALRLLLRRDCRWGGGDNDRSRLERLLLTRCQRDGKRFQLFQNWLELRILRGRDDRRDDGLGHDYRLRLLYGNLLGRSLIVAFA